MEPFKTRDMTVAATLVACGLKCLGMDIEWRGKKGTPVGHFAFDDTPELRTILQLYRSPLKPNMVHPDNLVAAIKALKSQVEDAAQ